MYFTTDDLADLERSDTQAVFTKIVYTLKPINSFEIVTICLNFDGLSKNLVPMQLLVKTFGNWNLNPRDLTILYAR